MVKNIPLANKGGGSSAKCQVGFKILAPVPGKPPLKHKQRALGCFWVAAIRAKKTLAAIILHLQPARPHWLSFRS